MMKTKISEIETKILIFEKRNKIDILSARLAKEKRERAQINWR